MSAVQDLLMLDAVPRGHRAGHPPRGDLTGISRETARIALRRLASDGWLHPSCELPNCLVVAHFA